MSRANSLLEKEYWERIKEVYHSYKANPNTFWQLAERGFLFVEFQNNDLEGKHIDAFFNKVENTVKQNRVDLSTNVGSIVVAGRLLFFDPNATMYDCLAEEFTDGFFDSDDVPPPEFWLGKWDCKLVSFIPSELVDRANVGVEHSTSGCLEWAADIIEIRK